MPRSEGDYATLFAELSPLVSRLIRTYAKDAEMKKDLHGEIYYQFRRLVNLYDPERGIPLRPYLVRQLTTSIYSYCRIQWRYEARYRSLEESHLAFLSYHPAPHWDEEILLQEVQNSLPVALSKLTQRQRNVVKWRYYDACSYEEIAERMQIKPATARSLLRHGLQNLRTSLSHLPYSAAE